MSMHRQNPNPTFSGARTRQLDPLWPIVCPDGLVVLVRGANARVRQPTTFVALGKNRKGHKELLGLGFCDNGGGKFWLSCLSDLKNRGLRDIFAVCVHRLSRFPDAVRAAYPEAKVPLRIVHPVRAPLRYVSAEDFRAVTSDLIQIRPYSNRSKLLTL